MLKRSAIFLALALPCAAAKFPDYPVKPAREYAAVREQSGIVVSAFAVEDPAGLKTYFGIGQSASFVPVLVVIENTTTDTSFLFRREPLTFQSPRRSGDLGGGPVSSSKSDKTLRAISYVPTIYTLPAVIAWSKRKQRRENFAGKEIQNSTISPGASIHGFVFVPAPQRYTSHEKLKLSIPLTLIGTDQTVTVEVEF